MIINLNGRAQFTESMDHRPCVGGRGVGCSDEIVASMFRSGSSPNLSHSNRTMRFRITDQTESAIIYVAVVIVFYAAIIVLLLGTNRRRPPRGHRRSAASIALRASTLRMREFLRRPTLAVYAACDGKHGRTKVIPTTHKSLKEVPSEDPVKITPL